MKELSLNILDIAENSVKAGARHVDISVTDQENWRTITILDDGCGMSPAFLARVTDPFTTTRTTRPVGMGIPLFKLASEQTGGEFRIRSKQRTETSTDHGTAVTATFDTAHVDCPPLGDIASTTVTLVQGNPEISYTLTLKTAEQDVFLSTDEMRRMLGEDVPLGEPSVLMWMREFIEQKKDSTE